MLSKLHIRPLRRRLATIGLVGQLTILLLQAFLQTWLLMPSASLLGPSEPIACRRCGMLWNPRSCSCFWDAFCQSNARGFNFHRAIQKNQSVGAAYLIEPPVRHEGRIPAKMQRASSLIPTRSLARAHCLALKWRYLNLSFDSTHYWWHWTEQTARNPFLSTEIEEHR